MARSEERSLPGNISKESSRKQLRLARKQGDQLKRSIEVMREEAGRGKSTKVDDYIVTYVEEPAKGFYRWNIDQLEWHNPAKENAHLKIIVEDAHDGRFVPYLDIQVQIFASGKDEQLQTTSLPFMWHPWLYHYGNNIHIESGNYDLLVTVSELRVDRHDKENGQRYRHPVEVRFENVPLTTGQKLS